MNNNQYPKNSQGLTIKEAKFVKKYIDIGNATEAIAQTYNTKSRKSAGLMARIIKKKPHIQEAIRLSLQKKGLTSDTLADNIAYLANARPEKITADVILRANIEALKLQGAYEKVNRTQSIKAIIQTLPNKTLILELSKRTKDSGALISEINANNSL